MLCERIDDATHLVYHQNKYDNHTTEKPVLCDSKHPLLTLLPPLLNVSGAVTPQGSSLPLASFSSFFVFPKSECVGLEARVLIYDYLSTTPTIKMFYLTYQPPFDNTYIATLGGK